MIAKPALPELLILSILFLPLTLSAGNEGMTEEQMQQMMEQAGKMQDCMGKIDQNAMNAYAARGEQVHAEIKKLCAAGKRDEAQKVAVEYGREMTSSREMQDMQQCAEIAKQMMRDVPATDLEEKQGHVCDGI